MYLILPWRDGGDPDRDPEQILKMTAHLKTLERARTMATEICRLGWSADIVDQDDPTGRTETWTCRHGGLQLTSPPLDA